MSNAATPAFLWAWRSRLRQPVALCVIELAVPTAATLHLASAEVIAGALSFEIGMTAGTINDTIDYLDPGPSPVMAQFTIADREFAGLAPYTLQQSLSRWRWKGARVRLYRWERSLTDFADALQMFSGRIDTISPGVGGAQFTALQDRANLTSRVASVVVNTTTRPHAPDATIDQCVPVFYGDGGSPPLRGAMGGLGLEDEFEDVGGGRGVVPLVLTDPGTGAAKVRVEAATHEIVDLFNTTGTCRLFMAGESALAPVDTALSTIAETLAAGGSFADIDDNELVVNFRVVPIDVRTGGGNNTALNPRRAMDIGDETSFATLDQSLGYSKLELLLPNPAPLGTIYGTVLMCLFCSGDAANTHGIRFYTRDSGGVTGTLNTSSLGQSQTTTGQLLTFSHANTWRSPGWEFGRDEGGMTYAGHVVGNTISLCVDFAGGTTNKARIYAVALKVPAKPTLDIIQPAVTEKKLKDFNPWFGKWAIGNAVVVPGEMEIAESNATFFANLQGYADDGSGTYTGAAGALIERLPDIVRHILETYGAVDPADVVTGAGEFGSFVDARALLRNGAAGDIKLAAYIVDEMTVQDACKHACEQGLAHFWQDVFDGRWRIAPWKRGDPVDYDLTIEWEDLLDGVRVPEASIVDVKHEVSVGYLFDHYRGKPLARAFVREGGSSQGWAFPTVRDQVLTIDASNDRLDWKTGAWGGGPYTFADTLAHGTFTPIEAAALIQGALRAHIVPGYYTYAGHGFTIEAGYNDGIEFGYGANAYQTTIPPGRYDADTLAHVVARVMNEAAGVDVIACRYSHSANKFTLTSSGSNINTTGPTTAIAPGTLAWPVLGWVAGTIAAASLTAPVATYAETFWARAESTATFQFLFGTGASASTSCATVYGWPKADTSVAASQAATYSRNDRETRCGLLRTEHGAVGKASITADWIRDERTAVALRNGLWDHVAEPPHEITFATHLAPDLRRMQTFALGPTIDAHVPFPRFGSDGSWAGKVLRCRGRVSGMGPAFHDEIVAAEA